MDYQTELALEELVIAMDTDGIDGINKWREARKQATSDKQAQAEKLAIAQPTRYGIQRLETGGVTYQGLPVLRQVETAEVTQDQLPAFAKHIGVKYDELMRMLTGERRSVVGSGGQIWQAWSSPRWSSSKDYVDSTNKEEFRAMLEKEDQDTRAAVATLNNNRSKADATYHQEPKHNQWR